VNLRPTPRCECFCELCMGDIWCCFTELVYAVDLILSVNNLSFPFRVHIATVNLNDCVYSRFSRLIVVARLCE
jgi:hypothetical protein